MNIRIFNICLLLGWLMVTGGTSLAVSPGWGLVTGGALLLVLTLAAAYLAGWEQPKASDKGEGA